MQLKALILIGVVICALSLRAQESITLTTPVARPSQTAMTPTKITIDLLAQSIYVEWKASDGEIQTAAYSTPAPSGHPGQPTGAALISTLNTANLSTISLVKRVLQRLQTDSYIPAGSIVGSPQ